MIRQYVDADNKVYFSEYNPVQDVFWYAVKNIVTGELYCFPVPRLDVGRGILKHEDKAITYMRWIRKALMDGTLIKTEG
jgi:hypothetical protein